MTDPMTKKFARMELVLKDAEEHEGDTKCVRKNFIDLRYPRQLAPYDKGGAKRLVHSAKKILFGSTSYYVTEERAADFFNDESNFLPW